jgi:hypothetical protein
LLPYSEIERAATSIDEPLNAIHYIQGISNLENNATTSIKDAHEKPTRKQREMEFLKNLQRIAQPL